MADDVVAVIKTTTDDVERLMKKLTLDITANLIETTPVDTGWARANWVPQITEPYHDSRGDLSRKERAPLVSEAEGKQGDGIASIGAYHFPQGPIYITNNVPYITRLNEGSSTQAPAAFVQQAIAKAVEQNQAKS